VENYKDDLLWKNISTLPYFRGFLRAVEGRYYENIEISNPLLDLGIGDGHFSATTLPGRVDYGIDPAWKSLLEAKKNRSARLLSCANGSRLPFPNRYFSTIISNSVLEHIQNLSDVLTEVKRVLKDDGKFVICVPNDNFTQNLSIAILLKKINWKRVAKEYQFFFNRISRHYHPDPVEEWVENLQRAGFSIESTWNYFPPRSLAILEWGHLFGIPSWITKKIFGKWILFPKKWILWPLYSWLLKYYKKDQTAKNGAYSFFIMNKRFG